MTHHWPRRLAVLAGFGALLAQAPAQAQAPQLDREVRFLNGFSPGGTSDIVGRLLADALSQELGRRVVVENRTGAGGMIAAEATAKARPDGHTLMLVAQGMMSVAPELPDTPKPIDVRRDLTPISNVAGVPMILVTGRNAPFATVPELIARARAEPGRLTFGSGGVTTMPHLSGELFGRMAGVEMTHVPYRGGTEAVVDIIAGRTTLIFGLLPELLGQLGDGSLVPVAMGSTRPSPLYPNLPTVAATVPSYEIGTWFGVVGPAGLDQSWVAFWNRAIDRAMAQPEFRARLADRGLEDVHGTPEAFAATIEADRQRWGTMARSVGLRGN